MHSACILNVDTQLAPAKLNLWLRLGGIREDGYQEIHTALVPLDSAGPHGLADEVSLRLGSRGGEKSCSVVWEDETASASLAPPLPEGSANLAWKAAEAFLNEVGESRRGFSITIRKKIPHGAGLGSGSSDAAAVLRALQAEFRGALEIPCLQRLAARLGSDVPFFLDCRPALATGRGEILTPLSPSPWHGPVVLIKPPFPVPTAWAYAAYRAMNPGANSETAIKGNPVLFENDLEKPVFAKFTILAAAKHWLREHVDVLAAVMCGSGSTLAAFLKEERLAPSLCEQIKEFFGQTWWVRPARVMPDAPKLSLSAG